MQTIIQPTIHSETCDRAGCSTCGQHHWRVSIALRPKGAMTGGIIVAWLMKDGSFGECKENAIRRFRTAKLANKEVERAFSLLRFCVEFSASYSEKL